MTTFRNPILPMLLVAVVGLVAWSYRDPIGHWVDASLGRRPLLAAKSWYYHLAKIDVDVIAKSDADLLVIDYAKGGGNVPLTKEEVARLKRKPDGRPRLVVSYLSIGEAEQYRFYWKPEYQSKPPVWDLGENCAWPKNNMVAYWTDAWKNILIRDQKSYLRQIIDAGFNGVYLDRIDAYWHHTDGRRDYAAEMKALVAEIKRAGSRLKPGFLVIAQNAEDLLDDRVYRHSIDGLGKEDLLFGSTGTNTRNEEKDIAWSLERLQILRDDYKPVFTVDYPETKELVAAMLAEHRKLGFVPTSQHRSLDGRDPTAPPPMVPTATVPAPSSPLLTPGTPEYIEEFCKKTGKKHW